MEISAIAFDADDTLWHSQTYFVAAQAKIDSLLAPFVPSTLVTNEMRKNEPSDLSVFGYGVKSYIISLLDAAISVSENSLPAWVIKAIIEIGRDLHSHPVQLLPGVEEMLADVSPNYQLALITKGDAVHQEAKLASSGISHYFKVINIVATKSPAAYSSLAAQLVAPPSGMLMVGNSVRSDIIPALEVGYYTAHIPYSHTWTHELAPTPEGNARFIQLTSIATLPAWLRMKNSCGN